MNLTCEGRAFLTEFRSILRQEYREGCRNSRSIPELLEQKQLEQKQLGQKQLKQKRLQQKQLGQTQQEHNSQDKNTAVWGPIAGILML